MDENGPLPTADAERTCPGFITLLVLRCGQGDQSALVVLMELLYVPVCARLAVAALPAAEAEELVGRAFVHIWQRAASYDTSQAGVIAWLLNEAATAPEPAPPSLAAS